MARVDDHTTLADPLSGTVYCSTGHVDACQVFF